MFVLLLCTILPFKHSYQLDLLPSVWISHDHFVLFCLFCGIIRKSFLIIWRRPWIVPNTWQKVQQWCAWNFARLQRTWSQKITLSCASLLSPCSMSWRYSMNCVFLLGWWFDWWLCINPSELPDQICNSPYCQLYNSYVSSENLVLDQLIIPKLIFFFIFITCLVDILLIL